MTCKLALTRMFTTDDMKASTNTDVHNRGRASWLLHGCPQQMTCKLALTRLSTTEVRWASWLCLRYVHRRWCSSWEHCYSYKIQKPCFILSYYFTTCISSTIQNIILIISILLLLSEGLPDAMCEDSSYQKLAEKHFLDIMCILL